MSNRKNYNFDMLVSSRYNADHSFVHKFGAVPTMSQNATGTVWDIDDTVYPWDALTSLDPTGDVVNITAVAADDELGVVVQGLDADYMPVEETITLNGTADTLGTKKFIRINRAFVTTGTNTKDIDIEAGGPGGTVVARISEGLAQTLMAVYTVPAHCTGYLHRGTGSIGGTGDASGFMMVRQHGQDNFRVGHTFEVTGAGGQYHYDFAFPIPIAEKSDIDIRATVRSNNTRVTIAFDLLLVDD
jgi:hypothetical protein